MGNFHITFNIFSRRRNSKANRYAQPLPKVDQPVSNYEDVQENQPDEKLTKDKGFYFVCVSIFYINMKICLQMIYLIVFTYI